MRPCFFLFAAYFYEGFFVGTGVPDGPQISAAVADGRIVSAPTVLGEGRRVAGKNRLLQGTAGRDARIRRRKRIVLTPLIDAGTKSLRSRKETGFGVGEQKWKAQPHISPEPNPDESLPSFCSYRKKVAPARAKRVIFPSHYTQSVPNAQGLYVPVQRSGEKHLTFEIFF
jgi:hypothetical protein